MYTTQMNAAKKGIVTEAMKHVAKSEMVDVEWLRQQIAKGQIVIPHNKNHHSLIPEGVGDGLRIKINVNLGISEDENSFEKEMIKVDKAIEMKVHSIMDLSCFGKTEEFRTALIKKSPAMIGTVPIYDALGSFNKEIQDITVDEFFEVVEMHGRNGVDFITVHAGLNKASIEVFKKNPRLNHIVSRGGSLLYAWMKLNNAENPFYEHYDRLLEICERYDITISLGDAMRPGSINDSTDASQIMELMTIGELTKRAWKHNVQVIVEGPGHVAINEIEANMILQKKLCHGAPFYVLGPIVTDVAPGYDHITSAIGGAIAASHGANFLCYVTPAEHLRLPTLDDMKEGIVASKIAAHAADIANNAKGAREWDYKMSKARQELNWEQMFELAIDKEKALKYRQESMPEHDDSCTMCGKLCSMRNINKIINA